MTTTLETRPALRRPVGGVVVGALLAVAVVAGCETSPDASPSISGTSPPPDARGSTTATPSTVETTSAAGATDETQASTATTAVSPDMTVFGEVDVRSWCDQQMRGLATVAFPDSTADQFSRYGARWREILTPPPSSPDGAPVPVTELGTLEDAGEAALAQLDEMDRFVASGDLDAALIAAERADDLIVHRLAAVAVTGEQCGYLGPDDVADARLNVPLVGGWQIGTGFGSAWVAREFTDDVVRLDPATGETIAVVDVGALPIKMQAGGGRMWVRTPDTLVAIDPQTNTVASTLDKADIGPDANRAWAVDSGLWICDGRQVHRYDPATALPLAVVHIDFDCGQVYATDDLVVAYTYNEDDGASGRSVGALIDPATNTVVHSFELPIDGLVPVVLDDVVYLPSALSNRAVLIDRATGVVSDAPSTGATIHGSQPAFDGDSIYLPAKESDDILVVDPTSFEVGEVIQTLGLNSVEVIDGEVWTANNVAGFVQAFER